MRYTDEEVIRAIDAAPLAVRDTISSGQTARTIADIGSQYKLHIDVIGTLAQLNRNMLIGLMSPAEVVGELVYSDVSAEAAKSILGDLNRRIFIPLQEQMRKGDIPEPAEKLVVSPIAPLPPPAPSPPTRFQPPVITALPEHTPSPTEFPVIPLAPAPAPERIEREAPPLAPPAPITRPLVSPPSYITDAVTALERPASVPPPAVLPGQEPINRLSVPPSPAPAEAPPAHAGYVTRTMAADMVALKEGKDPFEIAHPAVEAKSVNNPPSEAPRTDSPAASPPPTPPPQTAARQTPPATSRAPSPVTYGSDPYREPIE